MNPNNYQLRATAEFEKRLRKLLKLDQALAQRVGKTLKQLALDPFYPGLKTHKAFAVNHGEAYTSRVTGDIRIIWEFDKQGAAIVLLTIGGHDFVY